MDQIISMTRAIGRAIQADERYIRFQAAQQANDEDAALQELIGSFNEKRELLGSQAAASGKDDEAVTNLNREVNQLYSDIFANERMAAYVKARDEIQALVGFINQIITGSVNGFDPDTIEAQQGCSGSCSGCSGCE